MACFACFLVVTGKGKDLHLPKLHIYPVFGGLISHSVDLAKISLCVGEHFCLLGFWDSVLPVIIKLHHKVKVEVECVCVFPPALSCNVLYTENFP